MYPSQAPASEPAIEPMVSVSDPSTFKDYLRSEKDETTADNLLALPRR
jgi:hypothetical protein